MRRQLAQLVEFATGTDTGRVRSQNEDTVLVDGELGLAVVADGLGSYHAGEIASSLAAEAIREFVAQGIRTAVRTAPSGSTRGSVLLRDALLRANEIIYDRAKSQPLYAGMGAVVTAALFYGGRVALAHAGDTRAYRLRGGRFDQLTHDHVHQGAATGGAAARVSRVTRALGVSPSVMVDLQDGPWEPSDLYLLCSDGLPSMVPDPDIGLTLEIFGDNLETVAKQLIKLANNNGGHDNVSVVLARRGSEPEPPRRGVWGKMNRWFS